VGYYYSALSQVYGVITIWRMLKEASYCLQLYNHLPLRYCRFDWRGEEKKILLRLFPVHESAFTQQVVKVVTGYIITNAKNESFYILSEAAALSISSWTIK